MAPPPDPPPPKKWDIEWRCKMKWQDQKMPEEHYRYINKQAIDVVKQSCPDGTTIRIRSPIHDTTRIGGEIVTDPKGNHFTAEFLTNSGDWVSFHFYVIVRPDEIKKKLPTNDEVNPRIYWETPGKSLSEDKFLERFESIPVKK